ncbi:FAD-dependent 5-carboxymethylaminomethyl-2-thiouridine(34) oxidoreductase MnmC [Shewanella surugensis]|uniref:tRNA 5-methylaminomethyl-2-thiouridine biosynthesis bifunctional protein MnmC n=1 Tax=Shewanella surugensis TaxID=212020 RepID=A0ABT0LID7_9GAMM|nr:FAD-dependent 5-carboxymethylaminomethyl-2-thiouridine(34) oxidoreductase MnmC [Shewanella surugensis]MCL1127459.1 FAD-dependent 5-carboxymethylaminomethyl-2-thiouridine(34) oxidoreductase MnmC [Shewanella surugensis]
MTVSTLFRYVKTTKTDHSAIVLGQIGLSDPKEWLQLRAQHQKLPSHALIIKIFIDSSASFTSLNKNADFQSLIEESPALIPPMEPLTQQKLININGIQRLCFDNSRFILDFHIGDLFTQLNAIALTDSSLIAHWYCDEQLDLSPITLSQLWQIAKLSQDRAHLFFCASQRTDQAEHHCVLQTQTDFESRATQAGFHCIKLNMNDDVETCIRTQVKKNQQQSAIDREISLSERLALRHQHTLKQQAFPLMSTEEGSIAIIGGGLASANLTLSLASRQRRLHLFCKDPTLAAQASGNKQGALYPLLTPENNPLSQYFQQAFLFSRHRLQSLHQEGFSIAHDLCGVLHTGHDIRSMDRINKILNGHAWDPDVAIAVNKQQATHLAGVDIDKTGIFYPLGGWINPQEYTQAAIDKALSLTQLDIHMNTHIDRLAQKNSQWYLYQGGREYGPFASVVIANGHTLTQFKQTQALQLSGFRGQISHVPSKGKLSDLKTVLCSHGYLTPHHSNTHCVGASYIKNAPDLDFCPQEQADNVEKMRHSYPNKPWVEDIDVSDNDARVGVRMVTRDHAPMMGPAPDIEQILARYQTHQLTPQSRQYWQSTPAPIHQGLYILGGLGSRGLSSGPLAAEALAAMICHQPLPISQETVALLSPNRMWMRKLLKGKAL